MGEDMIEKPAIESGDFVRLPLGEAGERAFLVRAARTQDRRAEHRRQGQRHGGGDEDRHREGDGEFPEQPANHIAHEEERDQHRDQGQGQRDDGEADLP